MKKNSILIVLLTVLVACQAMADTVVFAPNPPPVPDRSVIARPSFEVDFNESNSLVTVLYNMNLISAHIELLDSNQNVVTGISSSAEGGSSSVIDVTSLEAGSYTITIKFDRFPDVFVGEIIKL